MKTAALSCAAMALVVGNAQAEVVWASYTYVVTLTAGGSLLSSSPLSQTIRFEGMHEVELIAVGDLSRALGGVQNNPLYKDKGVRGENPLHRDNSRGAVPAAWSAFDPGQFASFSASLTASAFIHSNGVIHRDLAARNVLLDTNQGRFGSAATSMIVLGADGTDDLRTTRKDIPIRWMPPESLRLYLNGDAMSDAYFDADISVEWAVIPSPASAALLGGAALLAVRRRR